MIFSLIVTTRGRTKELIKLFETLVSQTYREFDVIVVDQNEDDRVTKIVAEYADVMSIRHVFAEPKGKAAANNVGLKLATGDIVCFPDDDCWYPSDLLQKAAELFVAHPGWTAITGRESASETRITNTRFDLQAGEINLRNIWRRHISFTMFFRRCEIGDLEFNVELGIGAGTKWGAGEDTDFLLKFMKAGRTVHYDPRLVVCHPDWGQGPMTEAYYRKAHAYGMGMGRLLRAHEFPAGIVLKYIVRPAGGMLLSALRGRPGGARYYREVLVGRLSGWIETARMQAQ
jgi:glycosyltransferase involved in cell wall biosynthesis